jgi:hypothetical protein
MKVTLGLQTIDCAISATERAVLQVPVVQETCVWVNAMLRIDLADHKGIAIKRGGCIRVRHKRWRMCFWAFA